MEDSIQISVVIPTLRNPAVLRRVLDGYARQDAPPGSFEVIVVADQAEPDPAAVDEAVGERAGGYDEERFPYGYEDLDLGLRAREHGLRVLYNRRAVVDHVRPMTVELWQARAPRLAATEWRFCQLHPEVPPWFWRMFSDAAARPPLRGRAARLARFVPRS